MDAVANLLRIAAWMLLSRVGELIGVYDRDFVNGGTYSSGQHAEEAIIYGTSDYGRGLRETQEIFTFFPTLADEGTYLRFDRPRTVINGSQRMITGIRVQENNTYAFARSLADVPVYLNDDPDYIKKLFPGIAFEKSDAQLVCVDCDLNDLVRYVDITARLIQAYYFDGLTRTEHRKKMRHEVINNVDWAIAGLYTRNEDERTFLVFPYTIDSFVQVIDFGNSGDPQDFEVPKALLADQFTYKSGRSYNV
jgi:hypothetical protein